MNDKDTIKTLLRQRNEAADEVLDSRFKLAQLGLVLKQIVDLDPGLWITAQRLAQKGLDVVEKKTWPIPGPNLEGSPPTSSLLNS